MYPDPTQSSEKAQALLVELTRLLLTDSTPEDLEPRPETELSRRLRFEERDLVAGADRALPAVRASCCTWTWAM